MASDRHTRDVLGANLVARRKGLGLQQDELAEAAGVSASTISRLENGLVANPAVTDLARIARVLETTVASLLREAPPPDEEQAVIQGVAGWFRAGPEVVRELASDIDDLTDGERIAIFESVRAAARALKEHGRRTG